MIISIINIAIIRIMIVCVFARFRRVISGGGVR